MNIANTTIILVIAPFIAWYKMLRFMAKSYYISAMYIYHNDIGTKNEK